LALVETGESWLRPETRKLEFTGVIKVMGKTFKGFPIGFGKRFTL
ncbi:hypothetical protein CVH13_00209, partial [Dehalococcoides mccartyi]